MAPKTKGVKLTLHELGQFLNDQDGTLPLPTQSSGTSRERPSADPDDWTRGGSRQGRMDDRRTGGTGFGGSGEDETEADNWRRPPAGMPATNGSGFGRFPRQETTGGDDFSRSMMQPRSDTTVPAGDSTTRFSARRGMGTELSTRRTPTDADVDFSTARDAPPTRTAPIGPSSSSFGLNTSDIRHSSSISFSRFARDNPSSTVDEDVMWRNRGNPASSSTNAAGQRFDPRPEKLRVKYKPLFAKTEDSTDVKILTDTTETVKCEAALEKTDSQAALKKPASVEEPDALLDTKPNLLSKTVEPESSLSTKSDTDSKPLIIESNVVMTSTDAVSPSKKVDSVPQPATSAAESCAAVSSTEIVLPSKVPDSSVTASKLDVKASDVKPTATPSPSVSVPATTAGSTPVISKTPWRPSHLRGGKGTTASGAPVKSLEQFLEEKSASQQTPAPAPSAPQPVSTTNDLKAAYRRNLLQKEQRRREEEQKKQQERLRAEELERRALERLMVGDTAKIAQAQELLTKALRENAAANSVLEHFTLLFTQEDFESLVPSIVIAKCLLVELLTALAPLSQDAKITDAQRLQKAVAFISVLKPTLLYVFNNSNIHRHKLRFLFETQKLLHHMEYPRLSSGLSLIEALWDSLYMQDVIEQQYFDWWYEDTEDQTPGRMRVLFQMLAWFDWLHNAPVEGEEAPSSRDADVAGEEEEEDNNL